MFIIDDFRPEIGRYLGSDSALNPSIHTPNIDAFADTAVTFTNAHTVVSTYMYTCTKHVDCDCRYMYTRFDAHYRRRCCHDVT